jgi:cytochrome P450
MIYWILIVFGIAFSGFLLIKSRKAKKSHPLVVRVEGHWLLGNLLDFRKESFLSKLSEYPRKYGRFVELFVFRRRMLLVSDVSICKEILSKRPKTFCRMRLFDSAGNLVNIQSTLFVSRGTTWNRIRKSCAPSFSHLNISKKIADISKDIFEWVKTKKQNPNLSSTRIDMQQEAFRIATRVITIVAFGLPTDHPLLTYFLGPFHKDVKKTFAFAGALARFPFPKCFWYFSPKLYHLGMEAKAATELLLDEGRKIVNYKRSLVQDGKLSTSDCMVDSMVLNEGKSEKALTDTEIIMNVRGFYVAGSDTTTIILTWAAYYFALFPQVAEKVRQEVVEVLFHRQAPPKVLNENFSDISTFSKLHYSSAVVKEILRLKTPLSNICLELEEGIEEHELSNGITVHPGDLVYVNLDAIHMDENVFEDPMTFNPDRWILQSKVSSAGTDPSGSSTTSSLTAEEKLTKMQENFMPFGFGNRICPGMGLATYECLLAVSVFVYYFHFTLDCAKEDIQKVESSFVNCVKEMPVKLTPRTDIVE